MIKLSKMSHAELVAYLREKEGSTVPALTVGAVLTHKHKKPVWTRSTTNPNVIWWVKGDFDIAEANDSYTTFVTDAAGSRRAYCERTAIGQLGREIHEFQEHLWLATHGRT